MPKKRIDRFLDEALVSFAEWIKSNPNWFGKEHDCVNLFAHKFLFDKIEPGAAIFHPTQICIECALKQPTQYTNRSARKDLVIWEKPLQNTWSSDFEPILSPKAVMEWKVFRSRFPKRIFDPHDEEWIMAYTEEHGERFGYVVSVDMTKSGKKVYWKRAKKGAFNKSKCV